MHQAPCQLSALCRSSYYHSHFVHREVRSQRGKAHRLSNSNEQLCQEKHTHAAKGHLPTPCPAWGRLKDTAPGLQSPRCKFQPWAAHCRYISASRSVKSGALLGGAKTSSSSSNAPAQRGLWTPWPLLAPSVHAPRTTSVLSDFVNKQFTSHWPHALVGISRCKILTSHLGNFLHLDFCNPQGIICQTHVLQNMDPLYCALWS